MMPFPGGPDSLSNGSLILSAVAALAYLFALEAAPSFNRSATKTLSVLLLAVLALLENGPILLVVALCLSALGDAFLSRTGERAFLGGLASFLAAHLVYVVLFVSLGQGGSILADQPARIALGVAMLAVSGLLMIWLRAAAPEKLRGAVTAYALAIVAMGLSALTVPGLWVVLGAVSFMVSDSLLGAEKFLPIGNAQLRRGMRIGVWVLYYLAQVLIVLGILSGRG